MAEYIEREALLERLKFKRKCDRLTNKRYAGLESAIAQVSKAPTADVVEVVRCKDCLCFELMTSNNQHFCNQFGGYVTENDYCSRYRRGAKMDGKGEPE